MLLLAAKLFSSCSTVPKYMSGVQVRRQNLAQQRSLAFRNSVLNPRNFLANGKQLDMQTLTSAWLAGKVFRAELAAFKVKPKELHAYRTSSKSSRKNNRVSVRHSRGPCVKRVRDPIA